MLANVYWPSRNPLLGIPGASSQNFYEDTMHADCQGIRPVLAGGGLVYKSHDRFMYSSEVLCTYRFLCELYE